MTVPLIVCGAAGRMGRTLIGLIGQDPQVHLHAAIETSGHPSIGKDAGVLAGDAPLGVAITDDYTRAASPESVTLDFTVPAAALEHLRVAAERGAGIVIGTTGYSDDEQRE